MPGKPWPCGGGETLPPCRYLYLHLLFRKLQRGSPPAFGAAGMLPYRSLMDPAPSAGRLYPIIIHAGPLD